MSNQTWVELSRDPVRRRVIGMMVDSAEVPPKVRTLLTGNRPVLPDSPREILDRAFGRRQRVIRPAPEISRRTRGR